MYGKNIDITIRASATEFDITMSDYESGDSVFRKFPVSEDGGNR